MRYVIFAAALALTLTGCTTVRTVYRRLQRMFNDFIGEESALLGARVWRGSPLIGVAMAAVLITACDSTDSTSGGGFVDEELSAMKGTWIYSASFRSAGVTCEIQDMRITVGDPMYDGILYFLEAEASGGILECKGDTVDDFTYDLPSAIPIKVSRALSALCIRFTIYPPLQQMLLFNKAIDSRRGHVITADQWTGQVMVDPALQGSCCQGTGEFTAVRPKGSEAVTNRHIPIKYQ